MTTAPEHLPATILIEEARERFNLKYPPARYPGLAFEQPIWDLRSRDASAQDRSTIRAVRFTVRGDRSADPEPLPNDFTSVVKAWLVLEGHKPKTASRYANATRYLWEAIRGRFEGREFRLVDWLDVGADDLDGAEEIAGGAGNKSRRHSKANVAHILKYFVRWLDANDVCPGLEWVPATKKKNLVQHATQRGKKSRMDRLPTKRAIESCALIYRVDALPTDLQQAARHPEVRLLICAVGLLMVAGLRVNELVTLPLNCLGRAKHGKRERYFLRYWNQKSQKRAGHWGQRWLSPLGSELAQELVREIRAITSDAREQARRLEAAANEDRVPLPPGLILGERVSLKDLAAVHGITTAGLLGIMRADRERGGSRFRFYDPPGKGKKAWMRREDVERHLVEECGPLVAHDLGNGEVQRLSETLLIFRRGFLNTMRSGVSPVFVETLNDAQLYKWLNGQESGRKPAPSIFERFGQREPDGTEIHLRPHGPRHWLNTIANKAGMTALQITLWMQRSDPVHTLYYLHDQADLADLNREGIAEGTIEGPAARTYRRLPAGRREQYLESIRQAHKLKDGYCTADTVTDGCTVKKICEICAKHTRTRGSAIEREARMRKRDQVALALDVYAGAAQNGHRVHPRLTSLYSEHLMALNGILQEGAGDAA